MEAEITALAPWFGGKRNLAAAIVEEFGQHSAYWEPFCGSCAILFEKQRCSMETVNDLHGGLVNLARCVQDDRASVDLFRKLYRIACSEQLFLDAASRYRALGNVPPGSKPDRVFPNAIADCDWLRAQLGIPIPHVPNNPQQKDSIRRIAITQFHPDRHGGDSTLWKKWTLAAQALGIDV